MSSDANKQAEEKIKLETEMQILEKCMEDMKAVYKLNEEKLFFNLNVLKERSNVNKKTEKALKKKRQIEVEKERKQRKDFWAAQTGFAIVNKQLTTQYKQFTALFKDLQTKYERFEKSDDARIKDIWSMNDMEARSLVEKIMHADRVIHVQQLQVNWEPPKGQFFSFLQEGNTAAGQSSYGGADSQTHGNSMN